MTGTETYGPNLKLQEKPAKKKSFSRHEVGVIIRHAIAAYLEYRMKGMSMPFDEWLDKNYP